MSKGRLKEWLRRQVVRIPGARSLVQRLGRDRPFELERRLLEGVHYTTNAHPSILHFSVHKSATQYVKSILRRCALANQMHHVQFNEFLSGQTNTPYLHCLSREQMTHYEHIFHPQGYLYSVFPGMVQGIPDFESYLCVLLIRDPRDALTSEYFSIAYSHEPPPAADKKRDFMRRREKALKKGIDYYVLSECERVRKTYQKYAEALDFDSILLTKYEAMIADFASWLQEILEYCALPIASALRGELIDESYRSRPSTEDVHRHLRQVSPGDHRRKLQTETIQSLNGRLHRVLEEFGYENETV